MRSHVRNSRSDGPQSAALEEEHERVDTLVAVPDDDEDAFDEELYDIVRVHCPDCARPIAVFADEDTLPEHALCPTPWNPFGLTVCAGSGRALRDATPVGDDPDVDQPLGALLTLPAGLDWRTQPFSHVHSPVSRQLRVPRQRAA